MMLRSLVKKFKSHTLNEDTTPETGHQLPNGDTGENSSASIPNVIQHQSLTGGQLTPTADLSCSDSPLINSVPAHHERGIRCQGDAQQQCPLAGTTVVQMPRQHYLRSSSGCGCGAKTASSIATRLRSSAAAADTAPAISEQQRRQHNRYRHNCVPNRRTSGGSGPYYHGSAKMARGVGGFGGPVMDDACSRDSGTESDDEELEQIETKSTQSVPVSQTSDYYTSQQSLSINSCRSSHCSSPLLGLSDQECNSYESIGSESGISGVHASGAKQHRRHEQQCRHQKYNARSLHAATAGSKVSQLQNFDNTMIAAVVTRPPSEMLMTEELPQHHYHTRQQFQRLSQQISMKNGLFSSTAASTERSKADTGRCFGAGTEIPQEGTTCGQQTTAFVPVRRQHAAVAVDQSPEGAGSSSLDELEELNLGGNQQPRASRRSRLPTVSNSCASSANNCGLSEKRKWSQVRQEQKRMPDTGGEEIGIADCTAIDQFSLSSLGDKKRQERPILQAARKTPVKLLFSLDDGVGRTGEDNGEQQMAAMRSSSKRQTQGDHLPHQEGHASPLVGCSGKRLRSATKRCKNVSATGSDEAGEKKDDDAHNRRRCCKEKLSDEEDDEDAVGRMAKRPSLDFDKMRGKLVGDIATGASKQAKKAANKARCVVSNAKLKNFGTRREGYQLRSTHRRCCLFRPLELPATTRSAETPGTQSTDGGAFSLQPVQYQESQPWQQGSNGTFYFGSSSPG